jgi:hypothetical protein
MKMNVYDKSKAFRNPQSNTPESHAQLRTAAPASPRTGVWLVPAAFIVLSLLPLAFGVYRLTQLAGGAEITPANARFFASPLPVVIHIAGAAVYALLGAVQFPTSSRRRMFAWHRVAGRFLVLSGLLVGLSALWMTLFYSRPPGTGDLLYAIRLLFGLGMVLSIVLGFVAIRRREMGVHRAWMMRGYAIGLGAATQMLTLMVGEIIAGPPNEISHALLMGAGWVINLAVAEWAIRKRPSTRVRKTAAVVSHAQ